MSNCCFCNEFIIAPPGSLEHDNVFCWSRDCLGRAEALVLDKTGWPAICWGPEMKAKSKGSYGRHLRLNSGGLTLRKGRCLTCSLVDEKGLTAKDARILGRDECPCCLRVFHEEGRSIEPVKDCVHYTADNKEGPVRGILCNTCNSAEGLLKDSSSRGGGGKLDDPEVPALNALRLVDYLVFPPMLEAELDGQVDQRYFESVNDIDKYIDAVTEVFDECDSLKGRLVSAQAKLLVYKASFQGK